jgi:hypothetical protein
MFPHRKIHKYTWTTPDQIDHILKYSERLGEINPKRKT